MPAARHILKRPTIVSLRHINHVEVVLLMHNVRWTYSRDLDAQKDVMSLDVSEDDVLHVLSVEIVTGPMKCVGLSLL